MWTTFIKKALYVQKPIAICTETTSELKKYRTVIVLEPGKLEVVNFEVPFNDMGDAKF